MKARYLLIMGVLFFLLIASVSAQDNQTSLSVGEDTPLEKTDDEVLEETYYYEDGVRQYEDDVVVTRDVVKYYGDRDTRFKVTVYDDDYYPLEGVYVSFGQWGGKYREKATNSYGNVYFPINYKVGSHEVETYIESDDGRGFWSAYNTVKVKSTIMKSEKLVKYSNEKSKKFKFKFVDSKGKSLVKKMVTFKIKGKNYRLRTDSEGYVKLKLNLGWGKHRITAYNPKSKETRKFSVVILKRGLHKVKIRIDDPTDEFPHKRLKNGDHLYSIYVTKDAQYKNGVYAELGYDFAHTKLVKAKFYFKNKATGKVITKTSSKVDYGTWIKVKAVKGYSPFRATVWYRDVK